MIIIQTNCDKKEDADKIARALLKAKLVFVTHICPASSLYLWKGNIIEGKEFVLNVRTTEENAQAAMDMIQRMHPYQVPPIISMQANNATKAYTDAVSKELRK